MAGPPRDRDTSTATSSALDDRSLSWASREAVAMVAAWEHGHQVTAAEIIAQHPEIDDESAIRLIYEEVCLRRDAGLDVSTLEVVGRYPKYSDELQDLLACDRLLRPSGASVSFPEIGETIGPFRLLEELGRGASGRTFLATDPTLANRRVVVKIIPEHQEEHLRLAELQHTHIVPLFSEQSFPDRGLRILCMPYLGGTSLSRLLADIHETPLADCTGKRLTELIDKHTQAQTSLKAKDSGDAGQGDARPSTNFTTGPFRRRLEQASYPKAICWIVSCLAEALHHAHALGLVHMDIKPSNVLITKDGQPMLLDFHLSRHPVKAGDWVFDRLGGTPGWMSPEQETAMQAVSRGKPVPCALDHRTDIYSLGLLLQEALIAPFRHSLEKRQRVDLSKLGFGVGLNDIIKKCLAWSPEDRYDDAAKLAEDLRLHSDGELLKWVGNRSLGELLSKLRRRSPGVVAWATSLTLILVALAGFLAYHDKIERIHEAIEVSEEVAYSGDVARLNTCVQNLEEAKSLASRWPGLGYLGPKLETQIKKVKRSFIIPEVHKVAELIRFHYGSNRLLDSNRRELARDCKTLWEARALILDPSSSNATNTQADLRSDLREIAIAWADLQVPLAAKDRRDDATKVAESILHDTEQLFGRCLSVDSRLGRTNPSDPSQDIRSDPTPLDHYELAREKMRTGRYQEAGHLFQKVLESRPQDFWSNFYEGQCAYRLKHYEESLAAFRTCIALKPQSAYCYFSRAKAAEELGRFEEARNDYRRAIDLNQNSLDSMLSLGLLELRNDQFPEATRQYEHALLLAKDTQLRGVIHYNLAIAYLNQNNRAKAMREAESAAQSGRAEAKALIDLLQRKSPTKTGHERQSAPNPKPVETPSPRMIIHS